MSGISSANALIFGGAKGIGRSIALELGRRGANVAIADIDGAAAQAAAAEVVSGGGRALGTHADVLSEDSLAAAVEAAECGFGDLDILINNVGATLNGYPDDIPMHEWQRIMDLNYFSAVRAIKLVMPKFLARGAGHIVNTASFAGLYPYAASRIPYAAAKAAVIALSESLAIYLEPRGVRVSCLVPGPVMTGIAESITQWSEDCQMVGPGAETTLLMPDQVAKVLADGMESGRIIIPSDDIAFDMVRRWATSPDDFIRSKIADAARGEHGKPIVPEALRQMLGRK